MLFIVLVLFGFLSWRLRALLRLLKASEERMGAACRVVSVFLLGALRLRVQLRGGSPPRALAHVTVHFALVEPEELV